MAPDTTAVSTELSMKRKTPLSSSLEDRCDHGRPPRSGTSQIGIARSSSSKAPLNLAIPGGDRLFLDDQASLTVIVRPQSRCSTGVIHPDPQRDDAKRKIGIDRLQPVRSGRATLGRYHHRAAR